jgi:hypothetical protein
VLEDLAGAVGLGRAGVGVRRSWPTGLDVVGQGTEGAERPGKGWAVRKGRGRLAGARSVSMKVGPLESDAVGMAVGAA